MLEDFLAPAAARRLRAQADGVDLDEFCARLAGLGYSLATIHTKLWTVRTLLRWLAARHITIAELDVRGVEMFVKSRRRRGRMCRGFRTTLLQFVEQLPAASVARVPELAKDRSTGGACSRAMRNICAKSARSPRARSKRTCRS